MKTDTQDARANDPQRGASDSLRISYKPREGVTPEGETAALAQVYRYILFQCPEQKKTAGAGDGKEAAEQGRTVETMPEKRKS